MSLIDRVRMLAGRCTVQQARAAVAEVYRYIGEGIAMSEDPRFISAVLLDAARSVMQTNAAEVIEGVDEGPSRMPGEPKVAELVEVDTSPDMQVFRCTVCGRALWQTDTTTGKTTEHFVTDIVWSSDETRCANFDTCSAIAHHTMIEERLSR